MDSDLSIGTLCVGFQLEEGTDICHFDGPTGSNSNQKVGISSLWEFIVVLTQASQAFMDHFAL